MAGNAPQGSSSEAVSQVTYQADQETKPNIAKDPEFVNLQSSYQLDGSITKYRVRRKTKLQKLVVNFCIHRCLDMKTLVFLFEGKAINLERSPQQLEMEDGDEIDVMLHGSGGSMVV